MGLDKEKLAMKIENEVLQKTKNNINNSTVILSQMAKNGNYEISNIGVQCQKRDKNLVIMEKKDNNKIKITRLDTEIKQEVKKIFQAIDLGDLAEQVAIARFGEDGPIVVSFADTQKKMEVLRMAKKLKNSAYDGVYINNDETEAEVAHKKLLREEQRLKNSMLEHGVGNLKYGKMMVENKECMWYWGIRNRELKKIIKNNNL